jgi:hypothetical protein
MAIARYRSIPFGEMVMAGDSLAGREWQHRGWMTAKSARRQLFASAADAAVALMPSTSSTRPRGMPLLWARHRKWSLYANATATS